MRVSKVKTPILILSGLAGIEDKVKGLGFGADDYMTKPFHKDELIARIHAIVRRSKGHAQSVINTGDLVVNLDTKTVEVGGQRVHLTGKEYQMLELLSLRKGTTLTKEMFLNHLYGGMDEPELKIIDVFICKLRKKLANASSGKNYIETVWGRGYVLREPTDWKSAFRLNTSAATSNYKTRRRRGFSSRRCETPCTPSQQPPRRSDGLKPRCRAATFRCRQNSCLQVENGEVQIDPADLHRVYPPLRTDGARPQFNQSPLLIPVRDNRTSLPVSRRLCGSQS